MEGRLSGSLPARRRDSLSTNLGRLQGKGGGLRVQALWVFWGVGRRQRRLPSLGPLPGREGQKQG